MNCLPNANYPIPYLDIDCVEEFENNITRLLPKDYCLTNNVLPYTQYGNILTVFMGEPKEELYNRLMKETGQMIRVFKTCPKKLNETINRLFTEEKSHENFTNINCGHVYR